MPKTIAIILSLLLLVILIGAGIYGASELREQATETPNDSLNIVASIYPLAFFAEQIVQERGTVTTITPPGIEPHEYELTTRDVARMQSADIVIINGNLEPWAERISETLAEKSVRLQVASKGLATLPASKEKDAQELDPHVWLDPILAKQEMLRITNAIKKTDPARASQYMEPAQALAEKFDELDMLYKNGLATCASRNIVTSHAAFSYLANRYNLTQIPIAGISPEEEPSTQTLIDITKFVQENNVKYIFFESLVSSDLAQTIANETTAQVLELNPLEGLTANDVQQGKDYFSVMQSNLQNLQTALSCT